MEFRFELLGRRGTLRRGRYHTPHGSFETPCFAPVGTYASLKGLTPEQVRATGTELILANSYHLHLRPTAARVRKLGGLHAFMSWDGPILTDSGGYQIFSLSDRCVVDDRGVEFRSVIDGNMHHITPEHALEFQRELGPDIAMVLDHCVRGDADQDEVLDAHRRSLEWARRSRDLHESWGGASRGQAVFGIVQGGTDRELRAESACSLAGLEFDGYAIGGLSLGETPEQTAAALDASLENLPADRIRYLMGVGMPDDIRTAARAGTDLFDCVIPTRHGRNCQAFIKDGFFNMRNLVHAEDPRPIDQSCACYTCGHFSRAYLRHLSVAGEMLGAVLLTIHNVHHYQQMMVELRREAEGED